MRSLEHFRLCVGDGEEPAVELFGGQGGEDEPGGLVLVGAVLGEVGGLGVGPSVVGSAGFPHGAYTYFLFSDEFEKRVGELDGFGLVVDLLDGFHDGESEGKSFLGGGTAREGGKIQCIKVKPPGFSRLRALGGQVVRACLGQGQVTHFLWDVVVFSGIKSCFLVGFGQFFFGRCLQCGRHGFSGLFPLGYVSCGGWLRGAWFGIVSRKDPQRSGE